jgi:hypothetical protein
MSTIDETLVRFQEELAELQAAIHKTDHERRREEELRAQLAAIRLIRPKAR